MRSVATTSFALISSNASTERCLKDPSGTSVPSRRTVTLPRTSNSMPLSAPSQVTISNRAEGSQTRLKAA
jgi:hypothetical protein